MKQVKPHIQRFLAYFRSIDRVWLKTWIVIYLSFVALDTIFRIYFPGQSAYVDLNFFGHSVHFPIINDGTFFGVTLLKYSGIVLSFVYAHKKFPNDYLLQIALGFTLLADTILCINNTSTFGVLVFGFAQYFHLTRLLKIAPRHFIIYIILLAGSLMVGYNLHLPQIFIVAGLYGAMLITNFSLSSRWFMKAKVELSKVKRGSSKLSREKADREIVASTCAFYGFMLFILCDICVAASFLSFIGKLPSGVYAIAGYLSWIFYYPSQVLISNSSSVVDQKPAQKSKKSMNFAQK